MDYKMFFIYLAVTAISTYLVRVIPLLLVKKEIKNKFIISFLYYMPYAVLSVMTIPAIFFATTYVWSAFVGLVIAMILAINRKSLTTVAVSACVAVLAAELFVQYIIV